MLTEKQKFKAVRWASHVPIHKALIQTFNIKHVFELGAGLHSTPMFHELCESVVSVENDAEWIEKVKKQDKIRQENSILHLSLPGTIKVGTPFDKIRPHELKDYIHNCFGVIRSDAELMFVDCYAGFRAEALRKMHHVFKFVTFHDCEPEEDKFYGYRYFKPNIEYLWIIDKSFPTHTGILIDRKLCHLFPELEENHAKEVEIFAKQYDFVTSANLHIKE